MATPKVKNQLRMVSTTQLPSFNDFSLVLGYLQRGGGGGLETTRLAMSGRLMMMSLLLPCSLRLDDGALAIEPHSITLKTWPYLSPNFAIPPVPIRLRDL